MTEFGPAMAIFICFVMTPLIDISAIPVRYLIAQGLLNETAQKIALADSRTQAVALSADAGWIGFLNSCGMNASPQPLKLVVCGKNESDKLALLPSEPVPSDWLPGGSKGPCVYSIEMTVDAAIPPLYHGPSGLPGFTAPINVKLSARSNWENLGRNPATRKYFINE